MKARFFILIAIAAGLAVYFLLRPAPTAKTVLVDDSPGADEVTQIGKADPGMEKDLKDLPLPGSEPAERPEFAVVVNTNPASGKNQLCFDITEKHGYYVETLNIHFWHTGGNDAINPADAKVSLIEHFDDYIEANKPHRICQELTPAELQSIGGTIGTSQDWKARVLKYNRAREKNPDPLPPRRHNKKKFTPSDIQKGKVKQPSGG